MARSPAHRLGQIIGDELEVAIHEPLQQIADECGMYLDFKHVRPARDGKKKVAWKDSLGNTHDLDYVLEEGGSENTLGRPRAFIESAWRRYPKHSRNKAQEIQGAIAPLAETYLDCHPFLGVVLGVVLGGIFTQNSLEQFRSHKFNVVYCSYETILQAFASEEVDVSSSEDATDAELRAKVKAFDKLPVVRKKRIAAEIRRLHADQFHSFFDTLRTCLSRYVERILILTLSGVSRQIDSIDDAVRFISEHNEAAPASEFVRYELNVRYTNGDEIRGTFGEKENAIGFLRSC